MHDNPVYIENSPRLTATAQYSPTLRGVELSLWREDRNSEYLSYVTAFVVENVHPGQSAPPSCLLEAKQAQRLLNDLWNAGLRPTDNRNPNETIAAMQAHIASLESEVLWLRKMCEPEPDAQLIARSHQIADA